ncbi:molybdenum cofactor synthesis domain-containing protein [Desulfitispora alkaliphila]|uniref:molybdopterin adenylyltransferase n=1 Tax=Desulfitispora alkaliphila TaxID=622674 RepID=UPI003D234CBA
MLSIAILTVSDKGAVGQRQDKSGPTIEEKVEKIGGKVIAYSIVPDEIEDIKVALCEMSDQKKADVVFTTGGTGFSPRDVTPEATEAVIDRKAPGIAEAMRHESMKITPKAMLSRATAGLRGKTIIVNLPGSPKAVAECLDIILPALPHGVDILQGKTGECARK